MYKECRFTDFQNESSTVGPKEEEYQSTKKVTNILAMKERQQPFG